MTKNMARKHNTYYHTTQAAVVQPERILLWRDWALEDDIVELWVCPIQIQHKYYGPVKNRHIHN